ncbi:MAG TPA: HepT-like ribonuclease domain-containing protein [Terriglobia bacterium]|nr:HepT-like ribonuclease domain-containing protein [Terriglobia bacterium]
MTKADAVRLRPMMEAAEETLSFAQAQTRHNLDRNRMLSMAIVRCLEIIGEAAVRISPETKARFPEIPWTSIVGARNWLIYAYFDIIWIGSGTRSPTTCLNWSLS